MTSLKGIGKGRHPNSLKQLKTTPHKLGDPALPGAGRPKGSISLKERLQKYLDLDVKMKMPDGTIQSKTVMDSIVLALLAQAQKGNVLAIREVLDRYYKNQFNIPHCGGDLTKQAAEIFNKVSTGELTPTEGLQLVTITGAQVNIREKEKLVADVEMIKEQMKTQNSVVNSDEGEIVETADEKQAD